MPSLRRLHSVRLTNSPAPNDGDSHRVYIPLDTPKLCKLWIAFHFTAPQAATRLKFLSIRYMVDPAFIAPPISPGQIYLPELLELQLSSCNPGPILCVLSTPALQVLSFNSVRLWSGPSEVVAALPNFPHLRDLQWVDKGPDPIFDAVFQNSPILTRYSTYVVGSERGFFTPPENGPTILRTLDGMGSSSRPPLEEVQFKEISSAQALSLLDAVPTIKRIRILRDPVEWLVERTDEAIERETALLKRLAQRVDVAIWLEPWSH
ncbi:hypothetical protein FRB90_003490 [Tulasnella sp. 427]|nr:hypothetical protein FRB90_003490 [Tulasnella sp. 427]